MLNNIVTTSLVLFLIFIVYYLLARPLFMIRKLKKQQGKHYSTYFFPLLGIYKEIIFPSKKEKDDHYFMRKIVKEAPDTQVVFSNFGFQPYILLADTQLIKEFAQEKFNLYRKFTFLALGDCLFGQSLSEYELKLRREVLAPLFHYEQLKSKTVFIKSTAEELVQRIQNTIYLNQNKENQIQIIKELKRSAGDIIVKTFFGENFSKKLINNNLITYEVCEIIQELTQITKTNPLAIIRNLIIQIPTENTPEFLFSKREKDIIKRIKNLKQEMRNEFEKRILQFHENVDNNDFMHTYIKEITKKNQAGYGSESNFFIHQFLILYVAGMETSAYSAAMTLYCLSKNVSCQNRIRKEINDSIIENNDQFQNNQQQQDQSKIQFKDDTFLKNQYLTACIHEGIRLFTPAPTLIPRIADVDHQLGKLKIKKGTFLDVMLLGNQNNPKYFENQEKYFPERWLEENNELKKDPFIFTPFWTGPRNCIGQHLAMIEIKYFIAYILNQFEVKENQECDLKLITNPMYGPTQDNLVILRSIHNKK